MACSIDHLQKVASEGFPLTDELIYGGWQSGKAAHSRAPLPQKNHDHNYNHRHHQKQLVPNQYVYHGPDVVTVVQQPDTGRYHQIQTTRSNERWYVCQVLPQAPIPAVGAAITSSAKTKQKQSA